MDMKSSFTFQILVVLFLCFSLNSNLSLGGDTLSANESLLMGDTIISSGGNFELGFFNPGSYGKNYIAIWYKKAYDQTIVVWIANREEPVGIGDNRLSIIRGNLVLLDYFNNKTIWSALPGNVNQSILVTAVLHDDGNFILSDVSNPSTPLLLWQSFDYPTHTFLPGAKLGYDKHTQRKQVLISWKSLNDPPMGAGHEVSLKGPALNAFKGLAGRVAQIGVHLALLLVMSGGNLSAAGSLSGDVTVPQDLRIVVGDALAPSGVQSTPSDAFSTKVQDNRFNMDYDERGEDGEGPLNLAMTQPKLNGEKKLIVAFQRVGDDDSPNVKGISMLARDLQSIIIHDKEGRFACVRRPNSNLSIEIDGTKTIYVDTIASSGLDLKTDPGAQIVYAGFGFLMLTTGINILLHAQGEFPDIVYRLLDKVSESAESSFTEESDSSNGF